MSSTVRFKRRWVETWRPAAPLVLLLWLAVSGCAQFGVPDIPMPTTPSSPAGERQGLYVVYHPHTVLGFGHTGLIVPAAPPLPQNAQWLRFDQYASAELEYGNRLRDGTLRWWHKITLRLPSIFGLTRESVTRRAGMSPDALLEPGEVALLVTGLDVDAVRQAAEQRFSGADGLERETAERYVWMFNNCHHFVRDLMRAGGRIHERYFPKHFVQAYLRGAPEK